MFDIRSIADLVYKRLNPGGSNEFPHEYEEVLETVKMKYGYMVWLNHFQGMKDPDLKITFESLIKPVTKKIEFDESGMFITLDNGVIDLPRDASITNVRPKRLGCANLVKTTASSYQMYAKSTISKSYYRIGKVIRFPYGMPASDITEVEAFVVSTGAITDDIIVSDAYADQIREATIKDYLGEIGLPEDKIIDKNPNTEIKK